VSTRSIRARLDRLERSNRIEAERERGPVKRTTLSIEDDPIYQEIKRLKDRSPIPDCD
jgi:hypothetical protein